ncbi:asparagine synthase (glutamine-hydrolyzing) [bacterium]|jgi:asparagine synthase (glutamine-hydrolysing)|nr:asparagine synthase (glutamine-hydrolyzing) [bacterium]
MCGLTGFLLKETPSYASSTVLKNMVGLLVHRGPDHQGANSYPWKNQEFPRSSVHLGHRRLKILDLSEESNQPFSSRNQNMVLVYNGEIYNYRELRSELESLGHRFRSTGDTEVVLASFERWGTDCFARFNGMWALCIMDFDRNQLILSRDRLGEKPLYYYQDNGIFVFGSEIKSILAHPEVSTRPNLERIYRYISTSYRYGDMKPDSFFESIHQVPAGSFLSLESDWDCNVQKYWSLPIDRLQDGDPEQLSSEFLDLFTDSIRLRLRSDVPVGTLLSGGMDSTSVTAVARVVLGIPVQSFSGIMEEERGAFNESKYIESVATHTRTPTTYVRPNPTELCQTVEEMIGFFDEPICTVTWYAAFLLSRSIPGRSVPVLLNGHGGDELLGGYWDHYQYYFYDLAAAGMDDLRKQEILHWQRNHKRDPGEIPKHEEYWREFLAGKKKETEKFPDYGYLFHRGLSHQFKTAIRLDSPFSDSLTRRLFLELFYESTPAILKTEDRCTMAHSIESRTPFLDHRLVEFCFRLPSNMKIREGMGKWILRNSMRGILPEDVRLRKEKVGFNAPSHAWFRQESRENLKYLLSSESLRCRNLLDSELVLKIFEEHLSEGANHQMVLWQLLNLELWFQRFFPNWSLD